jgi:hypothetical protein
VAATKPLALAQTHEFIPPKTARNQMLPLYSLITNDVTDVATFPTSYIFSFCTYLFLLILENKALAKVVKQSQFRESRNDMAAKSKEWSRDEHILVFNLCFRSIHV